MPLDQWIREHSTWLGDRHFRKMIVFGPHQSRTYDNYYQILVDPRSAACEFIAAEEMIPLFDDKLVLKFYVK